MIGKHFTRRNLMLRQSLIAFSPLFTICFATQAHEQSPISFCDVIEFKNHSFVENLALPEVHRKQCKNWKSRSGVPFTVPIEFQHIKIDTDEELVFDRRKNNMPNFLPSFVLFDKRNNRYSFNWKKFEDVYNEWPMYQRNAEIMHADGHSRKTKVNFITRKTGGDSFVACEISYVNQNNNSVEWKETFYSFETANHHSVWYWSPLMSAKRIDDFKFLNEMNKIFLSMHSVAVGR